MIKGVSQAAKYGRIAVEIANTARYARTNRVAMALASRNGALWTGAEGLGRAAAGYFSYEGLQLTVASVPDVSWRDFVPGFASAKAWGEMKAACGE